MSVTCVGYITPNQTRYQEAASLAVNVGALLINLSAYEQKAAGACDALLVDFTGTARHKSARKELLAALVSAGRTQPIVVIDQGLSWEEAKALKLAGIGYFPTVRAAAFVALLSHPLMPPRAQPCPQPQPTNDGPSGGSPTIAA